MSAFMTDAQNSSIKTNEMINHDERRTVPIRPSKEGVLARHDGMNTLQNQGDVFLCVRVQHVPRAISMHRSNFFDVGRTANILIASGVGDLRASPSHCVRQMN